MCALPHHENVYFPAQNNAAVMRTSLRRPSHPLGTEQIYINHRIRLLRPYPAGLTRLWKFLFLINNSLIELRLRSHRWITTQWWWRPLVGANFTFSSAIILHGVVQQPSYDEMAHSPCVLQPSYDQTAHSPCVLQPSYDETAHSPCVLQQSYDQTALMRSIGLLAEASSMSQDKVTESTCLAGPSCLWIV